MRAVAEVVGELAAAPDWARVAAVGIGSAGPVDAATGTVSPVNIPGWRDFPLVAGVRALVGDRPVVLVGDGVAMTAAEHWQGAARGHANALCMVVSTGVGGGLVLNGRLHPGPTGNAGHIGHISVDIDGDPARAGPAAASSGSPAAPTSPAGRWPTAGSRAPTVIPARPVSPPPHTPVTRSPCALSSERPGRWPPGSPPPPRSSRSISRSSAAGSRARGGPLPPIARGSAGLCDAVVRVGPDGCTRPNGHGRRGGGRRGRRTTVPPRCLRPHA